MNEKLLHQSEKIKFHYILFLGGTYALLNYLVFLCISDEMVNTIVRFVTYGILLILVLSLKHGFDIVVARPHKGLCYFLLLPFLLPCFSNLMSIYFLGGTFYFVEPLELVMDMIMDLFGSIIDDLVFVDVMLSLLLDVLNKSKHRHLKAMLIASFIFTLVRCYLFFYHSWDYAIFLLLISFTINFICCFLSIYFGTALIPVIFHYLYNALNFVLVPFLFVYDLNMRYYIFNILFVMITCGYSMALYRIDILMQHHNHLIARGKKENENVSQK